MNRSYLHRTQKKKENVQVSTGYLYQNQQTSLEKQNWRVDGHNVIFGPIKIFRHLVGNPI